MATAFPIADAPAARAHALDDIRDALAPLGHEVEILESALDVRPWIDLRGLRAVCEELEREGAASLITQMGGRQSREDPAWRDLVLVGATSPIPGRLPLGLFIAAYERAVECYPEVRDGVLSVTFSESARGL